jgi:EAL domain-containing protein (putative c-di-GMP-specific phosphodiesterase class I)
MGYPHVISAASGKEALLQIEYDPEAAELIICDLNMPGMDGLEFLKLLNVSPFRGSVILLSGTSIRVMHSIQRLLGHGQLCILGALTKPADRFALQELLETRGLARTAAPILVERSLTAEDVATALRDHQLTLHYQPQVNLRTGELVGLEALVRCQHPEYGLVSPDRFLPIAERSGMMDMVTEWVFESAVRQLAAWRSGGLAVRIAINLSTTDLDAPHFWRRLTAAAQESGVPTSDVTLELTENGAAKPSEVALENLIRLQLAGFTLAIDDFGTGQSSLTQLRDVPFAELKIDRGFVQGSRYDQIVRPILEGSLGIARRMHLRSVAEGIETPDDWHSLRELDCDLAQGFLIARPMSAEKLRDWLLAWPQILDLIIQ